MIDYLAIGITHSLLLIMAWKLVMRSDLDKDPPPPRAIGTAETGSAD